MEPDQKRSDSPPIPPVSGGIGAFSQRLRESLKGESIRGFARKCGLSEGVLRNYLRGDTYPSLDRLETIAVSAGVNDTWLATGEGPMRRDGSCRVAELGGDYRSIDPRLIGEVIEAVESSLQESGLELSPSKKRELIFTVYDLSFHEKKVDHATVAKLIRLIS